MSNLLTLIRATGFAGIDDLANRGKHAPAASTLRSVINGTTAEVPFTEEEMDALRNGILGLDSSAEWVLGKAQFLWSRFEVKP